jgi:hypothetical protein
VQLFSLLRQTTVACRRGSYVCGRRRVTSSLDSGTVPFPSMRMRPDCIGKVSHKLWQVLKPRDSSTYPSRKNNCSWRVIRQPPFGAIFV